jgi:EmrB/QacA subfamily drug resistance transporter
VSDLQTEARPTASPTRPDTPLSHAEVRQVIVGIGLAMFLAALNQTIVATALPTIGRDFDDFENLPWIINAYLLTSTVAAPLYGKLSDIHGRRTMMLAAIALFTAGSLMCALAGNMIVLSLGRALQGFGGGGIMPLVQIIIADAITPRERGRYQAYIGIIWIGAGIAGPVFGGLIADHLHWSVIFWLNVPLGLIGAAMSSAALKRLPRHDRPHRLDLIGAVLIVASAVTLLLALAWGGTRYAWLSREIAFLLICTVVIAVLFGWRLTRAPEPFLPPAVLANPVVRAGTLASSCAVGVALALTVYLPLYFQVVHKLSASNSGLALIPLVVMSTPGSILSGRALSQMRHYKRIPIAALVCAIVAMAWVAWWPAAPLWLVAIALSIVSFGCGSTYPVSTVCVQNAVATHQVGTVTGVMNFFRALASALEVAVLGAIVLAGFGVTPERGRGAELLVEAAGASGADLAHVFGWVFGAAGCFLVVALVALIVMEERVLRGPGSGRPVDRKG